MNATATQAETTETPRRNREEILAAATRLIARNGVRGLRVEDVAADAGVSTPLLYYHFKSRAGLVQAALRLASDRAPSEALADAQPGVSGYEALEAALLAELDDDPSVRDHAVVWGEISATAVFDPELREPIRQAVERWQATVARAIKRGQADGSIRRELDPDEAADLLITLVDGLCTRWLAGGLELERARDLLRAAARRHLRASS